MSPYGLRSTLLCGEGRLEDLKSKILGVRIHALPLVPLLRPVYKPTPSCLPLAEMGIKKLLLCLVFSSNLFLDIYTYKKFSATWSCGEGPGRPQIQEVGLLCPSS
jgi:hypothetical protein